MPNLYHLHIEISQETISQQLHLWAKHILLVHGSRTIFKFKNTNYSFMVNLYHLQIEISQGPMWQQLHLHGSRSSILHGMRIQADFKSSSLRTQYYMRIPTCYILYKPCYQNMSTLVLPYTYSPPQYPN